MASRIFLLSPASCAGNRARLLFAPGARSELATRLRADGRAPIGEVFAFISQLYFRGKLAYARRFAHVLQSRGSAPHPGDVPTHGEHRDGVLVITTSRGLLDWREPVGIDTLREFAAVEMRLANEAYTKPLETTAKAVAERLGPEDEVVLLGSIASDKYVSVLGTVFGGRLRFPSEFVGRGDMSRGGLMLRCVDEGRELTYVPLSGAARHGARPPRLERRRR